MNRRKLLLRLSQGHLKNAAFSDIISLPEGLGFRFSLRSGSHRIYVHPEVPELVNLQNVRGEAKPYQIRQLLRLAELYDLRLEDQA
ncbi:MAG: type II toxin-antitoxin system HicA family toxin [Planctomycetes bacterium]|nr:type II toxin-antitoxin system HicA family toxin [Planctomycetota bacterium]